MPAAVIIRDPVSGKLHPNYDDGIPVGKLVNDPDTGELKYVLYNDWVLTVRTSEVEGSDKHVKIVGFEVEPRSYDPLSPITKEYRPHKPLYLDDLQKLPEEEQTFAFTYQVRSAQSIHTTWETRMDHYLKVGNQNIHYSAILLSLAIIAGLACILQEIIKTSLKKDFKAIIKGKMDAMQRRQDRQERASLP